MASLLTDIERFRKNLNHKKNAHLKDESIYYFNKIEKTRKNFSFMQKLVFSLLTLLIVFTAIVIGLYYHEQKIFSKFTTQAKTLPANKKIKLWLKFVDNYPHSWYFQKALKNLQGARETLFFEGIREVAQKSKTVQFALRKWQLYQNAYPNGKYIQAVKKEIAKCRKRIPVIVKIESSPQGASFLVNGKIRGKTPCIVSFAPSHNYILNFYLDGYQPLVMNFSLKKVIEKKILVSLKPIK